MDNGGFPYYALLPLLVFGPLAFWILYNFGLRDLFKMPGEIREDRRRAGEEEKHQRAERERKRGVVRPIVTGGGILSPLGLLGQGVAWAVYLGAIGFFSNAPAYEYLPPERSLIKLTFTHAGQRKVECRQRSREEIAKLAPNMRTVQSCPRERWPVTAELTFDGKLVFSGSAEPAGFSRDGPSSFYEKFDVLSGEHVLNVRIRDSGDENARTYTRSETVRMEPAEILVIGFDSTERRISFK